MDGRGNTSGPQTGLRQRSKLRAPLKYSPADEDVNAPRRTKRRRPSSPVDADPDPESSESVTHLADHEKVTQFRHVFRTLEQHEAMSDPQLNPKACNILSMLEEECASDVLAGYLEVITEFLSTERTCLPQIRHQLYQQILTSCIKLYEKRVNRVAVSEVIRCTVLQASRHTDINLATLVDFFKQTFTDPDCRCQPEPTVHQNMVRAMNLVCCQRITESRVQIAALGEAVNPSMLWLWATFGKQLEECLVEFWSYQMTAHHPGGRKDAEHGALAVDSTEWKGQLNDLYAALYKGLQQLSGKSKSGAQHNLIISGEYIELFADICHQVLTTKSTPMLEIVQLHGKRRKIESGWQVIRGLVCAQAATRSVIP